MKDKSDSVRQAIYTAQFKLAKIQDRSTGFILNQSSIETGRLMVELKILIGMIGEAQKNKEMSEFLLKSQSEYFRELDRPSIPLEKTTKSILKQIIMGLIIGGFLAVVFFVGQLLVRSNLQESS
jgi:hypothetical protein